MFEHMDLGHLLMLAFLVGMAWTDGVDRATGYLVTAANWNEMLGASGDIMIVKPYVFRQTTNFSTGAGTVDFSLGTTAELTTTGNVTGITLSGGITGGWHAIVIKYGGAHTIAFTTAVKWANGVTPTFTSVNTKTDVVNLYLHSDGTWSGEFSPNH